MIIATVVLLETHHAAAAANEELLQIAAALADPFVLEPKGGKSMRLNDNLLPIYFSLL